jgi:hypothetical protein
MMAISEVEPIKPDDAHNALSDAIAQAKTVVLAYRKLGLKI